MERALLALVLAVPALGHAQNASPLDQGFESAKECASVFQRGRTQGADGESVSDEDRTTAMLCVAAIMATLDTVAAVPDYRLGDGTRVCVPAKVRPDQIANDAMVTAGAMRRKSDSEFKYSEALIRAVAEANPCS